MSNQLIQLAMARNPIDVCEERTGYKWDKNIDNTGDINWQYGYKGACVPSSTTIGVVQVVIVGGATVVSLVVLVSLVIIVKRMKYNKKG